ncbi:MAG: TetR family transcriptional regulator C-terminal domain-containing protein [Candidatus Rokubacteria bacterium]|nr:TetR family transcriptional regulator C-terminal domain-containing protein [Candidatus Rokubacteria bacterium]
MRPTLKTEKPTRDHILAAASRLMALRGYRATSLVDVLRESGVGKGNFYYYFRSKEELGYAILERVVQGFVERVLEPCFSDSGAKPLDKVRCFLDRLLETQRQRNCVGGCPMGNLASELSDMHEGFRRRLAEIFTVWRERMTDTLREAQADGSLRSECDPASLAHFLVAALEGAILLTKVTKDIQIMETCVGELKSHLTLYAAVGRS